VIGCGLESRSRRERATDFPNRQTDCLPTTAVILADIDRDFLRQIQMLLLRRFVWTRAAVLLMLGGQEMFADTKFAEHTAGRVVAGLLRARDNRTASVPFAGVHSRGICCTWIRLPHNRVGRNSNGWRRLPPFTTLIRVGDVKTRCDGCSGRFQSERRAKPHRAGRAYSAKVALCDFPSVT